jgi:hypothetical protein
MISHKNNIINAIVLFHYQEGFQSQKIHTTTKFPMSSMNIVASQLQNIAYYYCITNNSFPSRKGFGWGGYWMSPFHLLPIGWNPKPLPIGWTQSNHFLTKTPYPNSHFITKKFFVLPTSTMEFIKNNFI